MASFAEAEETSCTREIVYRINEDDGDRKESEKPSKRRRSNSPSLEHKRSTASPPSSRYEEAENLDYCETSLEDYRIQPSRYPQDNHRSLPSSHSRHEAEQDIIGDQQESSVRSTKRRRSDSPSTPSSSKRSRKSSSPQPSSQKHKKHERRSRERQVDESGKHSDSKWSKNRDNSSSSSRKRSRSPREKDRRERKRPYHDEEDGTTRSRLYSDELSGSSKPFKIPKRERRVEDEDVGKRHTEKKAKISESLLKQIRDLVRTEHHHIESRQEDRRGDVTDVKWCYHYLDPTIRGHITGGRAHLHHLCRACQRTCLHLLGTYGTGSRKCLACASDEYGWREDEVPSWYFHGRCEHCENDDRKRGAGRGSWRGGYGRYNQSYNRY